MEALAKLGADAPITYDDLDDIFAAFQFVGDLRGDVIWYHHETYECGEFRAEPRYAFSILSQHQRHIVRRMIARLQGYRLTES